MQAESSRVDAGTVNDLQGRVETLIAEIESVVSLPVDHRRRREIEKILERGHGLIEKLDRATLDASSAVRRAAILEEDGEGDEALGVLVDLRTIHRRLIGPFTHCCAQIERLNGHPHTAARMLSEAAILCQPRIAGDALELLTLVSEELERPDAVACARSAAFALPGSGQDLDAAEAGYASVLEHDDGCIEASLGIARIYEARGERDVAVQLCLAVLASTDEVKELHSQLAYDAVRRYVAELETEEQLVDLIEKLVLQATPHEAERIAILPLAFAHEAMSANAAKALAERLALEVGGLKPPAERGATASLHAHRVARIQALLRLAAHQDLEAADSACESETPARVTGVAPATAARLLFDLWRDRSRRILSGEIDFGSSHDRLAAYLRTLDREVRWLGDAVLAGSLRDPATPLDIRDLLVLLAQMYSSVSDEPVTAEALAGMVDNPDLQERIEPILKAFFRRLRNIDRRWEKLDDIGRLDATIRAACQAEEESDFARDELIVLVNERIVRTGDLQTRLHGRLALAELYLEQRRFDSATEQATAAVELDPESGAAHYWLGIAHMRCGKRLLGLESLRQASEQLGNAEAFAAIGEDCSREEEPDFASRYYIKSVECALRHPELLESWQFDQASDWLRKAKGENDRVEPFPIIVDKKLPRKERAQRKKELEERNARRQMERENREEQMRELSKRLKWAKAMLLRQVGH